MAETQKTLRMLVTITGTRDGVDWPRPGEDIKVGATEAEELIASGIAEAKSGKSSEE